MPRAKVSFDTVRELALALPGVEEAVSWGAPSFKVKKKMFACRPMHKSAEPDSLVVLVDFMERDTLLAREPDVYYVKPHYVNYPCVLARLSKISKTALKELLANGHEYVWRPKRKRS